MQKRLIFAGLTIASMLCPAVAAPQSLADVARAEEARRKSLKTPPAKVYTNDDLRRAGDAPPAASPAADPATPATPPPGAAGDKAPAVTMPVEPSKAEPAKDEKYWRGRITEARQAVQRSQAFLDALQSQINGLTTEFVNTDDPAQRAVVEQKRLMAIAEQDRVKADIASQTQAIAEVEDAARRAGAPAGWLR